MKLTQRYFLCLTVREDSIWRVVGHSVCTKRGGGMFHVEHCVIWNLESAYIFFFNLYSYFTCSCTVRHHEEERKKERKKNRIKWFLCLTSHCVGSLLLWLGLFVVWQAWKIETGNTGRCTAIVVVAVTFGIFMPRPLREFWSQLHLADCFCRLRG